MKKAYTTEELQTAQLEIMKDMFISGLTLMRVPQREIAKVVRVDLNRVTRIGKLLKKRKQNTAEEK